MPRDFVDDQHGMFNFSLFIFCSVAAIDFTDRMRQQLDLIINDPDNKLLPPFWLDKYRKEQGKNWERFYKRNETNFFKDRTWLAREFEFDEAPSESEDTSIAALNEQGAPWRLLDAGCGVGNGLIPFLRGMPLCTAEGFDVSRTAVALLGQRCSQETSADSGTIGLLGVWDIIESPCPSAVLCRDENGFYGQEFQEESLDVNDRYDVCLLLFVLSAVPPEKVDTVLERIASTMKPGGLLLFRDYGRYDQKEVRFASRQCARIAEHAYVRQDGTLATYFEKEELVAGLDRVGLSPVRCDEIQRRFVNRKTGKVLDRCWIQGTFRKRSGQGP